MIILAKALDAWGTPGFEDILKSEIEAMDATLLPLQQGLSQGSYACEDGLSVMVISVSEDGHIIRVKTGVFFRGVIAGCSCADDPTPLEEHTEYCVMQFDINKQTAETAVIFLTE